MLDLPRGWEDAAEYLESPSRSMHDAAAFLKGGAKGCDPDPALEEVPGPHRGPMRCRFGSETDVASTLDQLGVFWNFRDYGDDAVKVMLEMHCLVLSQRQSN